MVQQFFYKKPAIRIEFFDNCKDSNGDGLCDSAATGSVSTNDSSCTGKDVRFLSIWGDGDSLTSCAGTRRRNWHLNDTATGFDDCTMSGSIRLVCEVDLFTTMAHELGHCLDVSHSDSGITALMMKSGFQLDTTERHLAEYDQICSDDFQGDRNVKHYYVGFNSSGTRQSIKSLNSTGYKRGMFSGGHLQSLTTGTVEKYSIYFDDKINTSGVGTDGSYFFNDIVTLNPFVSNLIVPPVVFTAREFAASTYKNNRINIVQKVSGGDIPPLLQYYRNTHTSDWFNTGFSGTYQECNTALCLSYTTLRSHIPMTVAWDEHTSTSVFARVISTRDSEQGTIVLHAGFEGDNVEVRKLNVGSKLNNSAPTDSHTLWNYSNKTDFAVGVACAPDRNDVSFNCLIAWSDRGLPTGEVLYKFFRVYDTGLFNKTIEWRSGTSKVLTGVLSVSSISAAYFDDSFWVASKGPVAVGGDVRYIRTYEPTHGSYCDYDCWEGVTVLARDNVIDPPTFFYVPHQTHEAALTWTESATQP